jgi:hypothetical protein
VIERDNPDVSGIFTVLDERGGDDATGNANARGKKYWRVGFRTVSWKVDDPNGDPLRFTLDLEREDGFLLDVRERIDGTQLAVDMTAVPDGSYRFRLTASDELNNPTDAEVTTASSGWFVVDNTAPEIAIRRDAGSWRVGVTDELSAITQVEWSRDGDEWRALAPLDGMLDGRTESFVIPAEDDRHLLVVRAIDRHHNRATQGVVEGSDR